MRLKVHPLNLENILDKLQHLKNKRAVALASVDQLETLLGDNIDDVLNFIDSFTEEELIEEYGGLEASLMMYAYALLVLNTTENIIDKLNRD
jgi:uncharacterized protein YlxP (DUF503 family)